MKTPEQIENITLRRWMRHDSRMSWTERHGLIALYPPQFVDDEVAKLRKEIARALEIDEPTHSVTEFGQEESSWFEAGGRTPRCGACKSDNLMEFESEHWFECEACHKAVPNVLGCLDCTHIRCEDCVPEKSDLVAYATTLDAIGKELGLSRERIRSFIEQTLRKLRGDKLYREFFDRYLCPPRAPEFSPCSTCKRPSHVLRKCKNCHAEICYWCWDPNCAHDPVCLSEETCRERTTQASQREAEAEVQRRMRHGYPALKPLHWLDEPIAPTAYRAEDVIPTAYAAALRAKTS